MSKQEIVLQLTLKIIEVQELKVLKSATNNYHHDNDAHADATGAYVTKIFNMLMRELEIE